MRISPARVWRERSSRYRLEGTKCRSCGRVFYPPKPMCPVCGSRDVVRIELPQRGRVITWTVQYTVPTGYRARAPLILAIIELENGVRVLSALTDVSPDEVSEGMEVEATLRRLWEDGEEGVIVYGIKFAPVTKH
ncbi:MAG TPA: Zn-ribbon domain-containing OB-fold protein [Ignisphaera aggregans]|uniref:Zn-ribbon domain-containing OB-fold protein n=1 Tax=Ignisphaera aggregans TaxID=334771 RepID=A0A833DTA5_9CREN|nr:Zn-ribbon domain-containing OB-fold protein [Ignisphaera aggregans]